MTNNTEALNYDPADPDKMKLPANMTCGDCRHISRCKAMFGHTESDTYCDWSPSRFMAQGLSESEVLRTRVRQQHAEWSQTTFGSVGPVGPLKHLSKEALEAAAEPGDLSEWADMQFLLWDAQRRAGITDEQIVQAMIEKLAVNKTREWPEPKDGEPRLHINTEVNGD